MKSKPMNFYRIYGLKLTLRDFISYTPYTEKKPTTNSASSDLFVFMSKMSLTSNLAAINSAEAPSSCSSSLLRWSFSGWLRLDLVR